MNILMLSWEYPPRIVGGIARVVGELSKQMVKQGHRVTVVTYREEEMPYYEKEETGVEVYRVDNYMIKPNNFIEWIMQLNFNMVSKVNELILKGEKFDIIHAHDWLVAYAAKTIKQSAGIPLVSTIHATESGRNSGIHTEMQRYINDTEWLLTYESEKIIVNSNFMKNEVQRLFGLDFEKIDVVKNGIDLDKFDGIEKDYNFRRNYASDNEKIIFTIGRLVNEKGIQHLIHALPKVLQNYNDTKLIIAGKGGMMPELQNMVSNLGLNEKVYFTGYLSGDEVQKMYKVSDIAVFPSTYEPFGIVALEAMLGGIPVVTSDIGGLNEIISHRENGIKTYAGNANSLADGILTLLFDHELAHKVTKNAKIEVISKYNWEIIAENTLKTFIETISIYNDNKERLSKKEEAETKIDNIEKLEENYEEKLKEYMDKETGEIILKNKMTQLLKFGDSSKILNG